MSSGSRKTRRVYGAVRDFDKDSLELGNDKDDDSDSESSNLSSKDNNSDDGFSLADSDAENNSANLTKKQNNKKKKVPSPIPEKKKRKIEKGQPETKAKKGKTKALGSPKKAGGKKAIVKVESDTRKTESAVKKDTDNSTDSYDILLPSSILNGGGGSSDNQCTLLVEVSDSKDAIALGEFGGSIGAIGRFESDSKGITLDLKGNQYRGSLLPGPTCLVVGFPQSFGFKRKDATIDANGQQIEEDDDVKEEKAKLRVEGIVDEYATIVQIDDHMKKLDAIVVENNIDDTEGKTI